MSPPVCVRARASVDVEQRQLKAATEAQDSAAPPAAPPSSARKSDSTFVSRRGENRSRTDATRSRLCFSGRTRWVWRRNEPGISAPEEVNGASGRGSCGSSGCLKASPVFPRWLRLLSVSARHCCTGWRVRVCVCLRGGSRSEPPSRLPARVSGWELNPERRQRSFSHSSAPR